MSRRNRSTDTLLIFLLILGLCVGLIAPSLVSTSVQAAPLKKPLYACASTFAQWTFTGNSTIPSVGATLGSFSTGSGLSSTSFVTSGVTSPPALNASSWSTSASLVLGNNDYIQLNIDTTNRNSINLTFDNKISASGPSILEIYYSTDGSSFLPLGTTITPSTSWSTSPTIDFSSIPALENNPAAAFRIYGYSSGSTAGTLQIDNINFTGNCIVEPTIIISEVAWAGTIASGADEWIELYNLSSVSVDITGWSLKHGSATIALLGTVPAGGFFLLENNFSATGISPSTLVSIQATGSSLNLSDVGEVLQLLDNTNNLIDTANADGGAWPAGGGIHAASMERVVESSVPRADDSSGWITFADTTFIATDVGGNYIHGTPGAANWAFSVTPTFTPTITPSFTATFTPSFTPSNTPTKTFTPTNTSSPTDTNTPSASMAVIINEVAWAGTLADTNDEWVEFYNPGLISIDLTGWKFKDSSSTITLSCAPASACIIPAGGYFLLEDNENAVADITANMLSSSLSLSNSGEVLQLLDTTNTLIDTANGNGGAWPAGLATGNFPTMERKVGTSDSDSSWFTNGGVIKNGIDSGGNPIWGTPKNLNSPTLTPTRTRTPSRTPTKTLTRTPTKTRTPTRTPTRKPFPTPTQSARVVINEFLPHPGFDWNQDGKNDVYDEFIEIINYGPNKITLNGWKLTTKTNPDSFTIPSTTLQAGQRLVFYGSQTGLRLSDGGETIRLLDQRGTQMDSYNYAFAVKEDVSWCRIPDGLYNWYTDCVPTPNQQNKRAGQPPSDAPGTGLEETRCKNFPDTVPNDFLIAECNGYGSLFWRHMYWDGPGDQGEQPIWNDSKWGSFVE